MFWRQGYDGSSIEDLLEATGLHKGSLYKAFGDKRALYIKSLERYMAYLHEGWKKTRASTPSPKESLRRWFHFLVTYEGAYKGCLVANASAEVAPRDPEIAAMLRGFTAALRGYFTETIESGKALGELRKDVDANLAAELLVIVMMGIRVVGKHSPLTRGLVDVILGGLA